MKNEELGFSELTQMIDDYTTNSHSYFSSYGWELFELGRETLMVLSPGDAKFESCSKIWSEKMRGRFLMFS